MSDRVVAEKLNIYTRILTMTAMVFGVVVFSFFSATSVSADSFDYNNSGVTFGALSNFASGLVGDMKDSLKDTIHEVNIANNKKDEKGRLVDSLQVLHIGFNGYYSEDGLNTTELTTLGDLEDEDIVPEVVGEALVYPNPFRLQTGVAKLGYRLSKDMDIQIQMYDMMGSLILKRSFFSGAAGAQKGYNKLRIDNDVFEGELLSSGVYFYLIIHDGKVMAKGKMAIKP